MTEEERAVMALPEKDQRTLAGLVLGGWTIRREGAAQWHATDGEYNTRSTTLLTLIDQIVYMTQMPDRTRPWPLVEIVKR